MTTLGTLFAGGIDPNAPSPQTVARSSTQILVSNTTDETEIFGVTVNGNVLTTDRSIEVKLWGVRVNSSGGTVAYRFRVRYGATVMWEHQASFFTTSAECPVQMVFELRADNADDSQKMDGRISIHSGGTPDVGRGSIALGMDVDSIIQGDAAEDATTDLDFSVTVEMDTADVAALLAIHRAVVKII